VQDTDGPRGFQDLEAEVKMSRTKKEEITRGKRYAKKEE
jgi:hypothetical protein